MAELALNVPRELRRGRKAGNEEESVESGLQLINLMADKLGLKDFGNSSMLDIGCGCKFVQAFLTEDLPLGSYVGVDVFPQLIEFLKSNVTDPRYSFHTLNAHNEMYNTEGEPLSENTRIPMEEASSDVICLYSVFTHLAPHDYVAMLKMLRRYVKPDGKLMFTLFLNERTEGGLGFIDNIHRSWAENAERLETHKDAFRTQIEKDKEPDFLDYDPANPLKWAIYSRENAIKLVAGTGWEIESLNDPETAIQHYMICRPV
jgi:SAM-dependent methyltransferase